MTENNVIAPENIAPPLHYAGQLWSKESAHAKLTELDADQDFKAALLKGDMVKVAERTAYKQMSLGRQPGPTPAPQTTGDVLEQARGRDLEIALAQAEGRREDGVEEITIYESQNDRPIPPERKAFHRREIKRLKSDPEFVRRYLTGDLEARQLMSHHHVSSVMRVGTPEEIRAWEMAHFGEVFS